MSRLSFPASACATGTPPHNIVVDLGKIQTISEVRMAHAEAGNESRDMNTSDYTIEVSEDGVNFTEVVNVKKNSAANTINTFKAIPARYVRVTAGSIEGIIKRLEEELNETLLVVLTGGLSSYVIPLLKCQVKHEQNLQLFGLYEVYKYYFDYKRN